MAGSLSCLQSAPEAGVSWAGCSTGFIWWWHFKAVPICLQAKPSNKKHKKKRYLAVQDDSLLVQGGEAQLIHDGCSIIQAGCLQVLLQQLAWICGPLPASTDPHPISSTSRSTVLLLMLRGSWLSTAFTICLLRQLRHGLRRGLLRVQVAGFLD